jgi:hypothetical protein
MNSRTATQETARTKGIHYGMNWISQEKRLAIYLRDGMCCVYCKAAVENGTQLTLDHIKPHIKGGSNHESNLVTACHFCNTSRNATTLAAFARKTATVFSKRISAEEILGTVRRNTARKLAPFVAEAKEVIARRGGLQAAIAKMSNN